jgi:glyoxylase-like metal-dependent hydrolase (beta-lactamase superfamily II)
MKEILPGCYMIALNFVNAYLIEEEGKFTLIDTGYPNSASIISQKLESIGKHLTDIEQILVTHCHSDHSGSLAELKRLTKAPVYMHALDADMVRAGVTLRSYQPGPGVLNNVLTKLISGNTPSTIEACEVDHELSDGEQLPFGEGIKAIHIPGHCAGQLAFLWKKHQGVLFAADAAKNMFGLDWSFIYEDINEGKRSLAKISNLKFETALFGHGKPIFKNAAQRFKRKWGDF